MQKELDAHVLQYYEKFRDMCVFYRELTVLATNEFP